MTSLGVDGHWIGIHDGDLRALDMFKRHYSYRHRANGKRRGSNTFIGQGEKMVLLTATHDALFAWQRSITKRMDNQEGVCCSIFRNEGSVLSSVLIREAMELAWARWPSQRLFTYVRPSKIQSVNPGYCFKMAGWTQCGWNKDGRLTILEALPMKDNTIIEVEELG
jgi:hypothetical protein